MKQKSFLKQIISGSLLVAGTTIGAGMLGIPMVTFETGFFYAFLVTTATWIFMMVTGFLFLEATLWMHEGANVLSITKRFLGNHSKIIAGGAFVFLYYCLLVAYIAGGTPIFSIFLENIHLPLSGIPLYGLFTLIFLIIVAFGLKVIDRVNYMLMAGLIVSYIAIVVFGSKEVHIENLLFSNVSFEKSFFALPVLFGAFGYHNIIPSLTFYFKKNPNIMKWSIFWGTFLAYVTYLLWQFIVIGAVPKDILQKTLELGAPATFALQQLTQNSWIKDLGAIFGFFALITSLLGVAFSVVDFLGDGLKMKRIGFSRIMLCFFTFLPPFLIVIINPDIFLSAVSIAGGFGEALLNGALPALLVWSGVYRKKLYIEDHSTRMAKFLYNKIVLTSVLVFSFLVMVLEAYLLMK